MGAPLCAAFLTHGLALGGVVSPDVGVYFSAGLGNKLWVVGQAVAAAALINRTVVLPCADEQGRVPPPACRHLPLFGKVSNGCVANWTEFTSHGSERILPSAAMELPRATPRNVPIIVVGYAQYAGTISEAQGAVCDAFRPDGEYLKRTVAALPPAFRDPAKVVIAVHVRRGDYMSSSHKWAYHGILQRDYFVRGFQRLVAHANRTGIRTDQLHLAVFCEESGRAWAEKNVVMPGIGRDIVVDVVGTDHARNGRCAGEESVLLGMAMADYLVTSHSSFSWWAHFLNRCTRTSPWEHARRFPLTPTGKYVFPHHWYNHRRKKVSETFNMIPGNVIVDLNDELFEPPPSTP
jgi:hypothetical protein